MTSHELAASADAGDVALLPVGSIEQHGTHLPVDTDISGPHAAALQAAADLSWAIVAPPVWWGLSGAHREFAGTITLRPATMYNLLEDVCGSITDQGFKLCLIVGHASNIPVVSTMLGEFASQRKTNMLQLNYLQFGMERFAALRRSGPGGESHAGELETSVQMHLRSHLVKMDAGVEPHYIDSRRDYGMSSAPGDILEKGPVNIGFDLARVFPRGVLGDPTEATSELGARCWEAIVEGVKAALCEFHDTPSEE